MNAILVDPEILLKKVDPAFRTYEYTCFDVVSSYIPEISPYKIYLNSIEEFQLKNIWNDVISRWNKMKRELSDNPSFKRSRYSKGDYHQIHRYISEEELNALFTDFIGQHKVKSIFVLNCIQKHIYSE